MEPLDNFLRTPTEIPEAAFETELLRGSLRSRCNQAKPAFAAMLLNSALTVPLLGRGLSPALLAIWLSALMTLLLIRYFVAQRAQPLLDGPPAALRRFDSQFRALSIASQAVTGAGIWLVPTATDEIAAYVLTLLISIYAVGTTINLAHDFRSLRISMPVLMAQPAAYWFAHGVEGVVIGVILVGITVMLVSSARNSQLSFDETIRMRFEKDELLAQLEREKRIANEARQLAEVANRAKSSFMAAASHDLRQPLYAATLLTDTLALHPLNTDVAALVAQQRSALNAASSLFDNLLDLSKFESGVIEPVIRPIALTGVFEQMQTEFRHAAQGKGLDLLIESSPPCVSSDFELLTRVIRNLVSNAIRYTPAGSVRLGANLEDGQVIVFVEDTGIGIAKADQERVFKEFVQLGNPHRSREQGLGLGLAIVRHIVELLGHELAIESAPGRGTRISVGLPPANQDAAGITTVDDRRSTAFVTGQAVWIVEDDPLVRDALGSLLERQGCAWRAATDRATLGRYERESGLPDFVILDDMLGDIESGLEIAHWLAERMPKARILLTTGNIEAARWQQLSSSGFAVQRKPVSATVLNEWMQTVLDSSSGSTRQGISESSH